MAEFIYVLRIQPGGIHADAIWEVAFTRPPTTSEAICHIQDQTRTGADVDFAMACIDTLKQRGVPEHYRAGSQGVRPQYVPVELVLMRAVTLPIPS